MNATHNLKRIIAGTAVGRRRGNRIGAGGRHRAGDLQRGWDLQHRAASNVKWDMSVCHHYYSGTVGEPGTNGGIQVGAHIIEGDPSPVNPCGAAPICLPGL
jgi:hypothetical protein